VKDKLAVVLKTAEDLTDKLRNAKRVQVQRVQAAARLGVPPDIDAGLNDAGGSSTAPPSDVGGSSTAPPSDVGGSTTAPPSDAGGSSSPRTHHSPRTLTVVPGAKRQHVAVPVCSSGGEAQQGELPGSRPP